jgi:F420-dependent oxidoreductase-like protein
MTRFGLQIPDFRWEDASSGGLFPRTLALAEAAESSGFETLWVMDHFHELPPFFDRTDPMPEGYTLLAGLAARTKSIELGTLVTGVPYRNPALLAKQVTTLDHISGGRAILGVGAGWNEDEYVAYGFGEELPSIKERLDRLDEAIRICRAMFESPSASFEGDRYRVSDALNSPPPLRSGGPPIMIGGGGEKRLLRILAELGDMTNYFGDPDTVRHKNAVLERHCEDVGRDPREIERSRLGAIILADTDAEAARIASSMREQFGMDEDFFNGFFDHGGPDRIRERVEEFVASGLDHFIVMAAGPALPDQVAGLGEVFAPLRG